jgi:hypothetical protein
MALHQAVDRLDGPEFRRGVEPTIEDKSGVLAVAGDDVLPLAWQAAWGIDAEEVAQGRLTKSVEMFVVPEERRLRVQVNARLLANLPHRRVEQISMVEDEQRVSPLDVDNDSLPQRHLMIVGRRAGERPYA